MSRVLVVAEHDGARLDAATAKCVRCALDLKPNALVVAVLANGGADVAAQAARLKGVTQVVLVDAPHNAEPLAAILAPQLNSLAEGFTHLFGPSSTFGKDLLPRGSRRTAASTKVRRLLSRSERWMSPCPATRASSRGARAAASGRT